MPTTTQTADAPRRGKTHPPSENRVWDFFQSTHSCTQENWQITQCSRPENQPTPTATASGVPYYGYRYYRPELGRWPSRDPIEEWGGLNLYRAFNNSCINYIDPIGANIYAPGTGEVILPLPVLPDDGNELPGFPKNPEIVDGLPKSPDWGIGTGRPGGSPPLDGDYYNDIIDKGKYFTEIPRRDHEWHARHCLVYGKPPLIYEIDDTVIYVNKVGPKCCVKGEDGNIIIGEWHRIRVLTCKPPNKVEKWLRWSAKLRPTDDRLECR